MATVSVFLNVGLFMRVPGLLLAKSKAREDGVEEGFGAAVEADEEQQEDTKEDANDDTCNGSTAKTSSSTFLRDGSSIDASGDWRGKGNGCGWTTGGDYASSSRSSGLRAGSRSETEISNAAAYRIARAFPLALAGDGRLRVRCSNKAAVDSGLGDQIRGDEGRGVELPAICLGTLRKTTLGLIVRVC